MTGSGNDVASTSSSSQLPTAEVGFDENEPLLSSRRVNRKTKKPFYRARPLWIVPFGLVAAIVRGMTLAPRVEVFTQLSCNRVYLLHVQSAQSAKFSHSITNSSSIMPSVPKITNPVSVLGFPSHTPESEPFLQLSIVDKSRDFVPGGDDEDNIESRDSTGVPQFNPSHRCVQNPNVQAGAARLQMTMTTTMGLLSALTTGAWGYFGERYGRTSVLAISTLGLFMTDLAFVLASNPGSAFAKHGHKLLLVAPVIEGALGGWPTLQASTSAYISDCTSSGSRAQVFSRFTGVTYLGVFLGPSIGGYLISRFGGSGVGGTKNVTSVFLVAVCCSFINFLAAVLVFPESLSEEKRRKARAEHDAKGKAKMPTTECVEAERRRGTGVVRGLFGPIIAASVQIPSVLAVFKPVKVRSDSQPGSYRRDSSLTALGVAYFSYMLTFGLYQLKYLYTEHVYGWGAEQLSWYISYLGGVRATALLVVLPFVIGIFKPKAVGSNKRKNNSSVRPAIPAATTKGRKTKLTRSQLGREIAFDLSLVRCSLFMDMISDLLVIVSPAPMFHKTSIGKQIMGHRRRDMSLKSSETLFVLATGFASFGTGGAPAMHSLALCLLQARETMHPVMRGGDQETAGGETSAEPEASTASQSGNIGGMFGAFALLQSIGSMILGPILFGMVYSSTVAGAPKAIFIVAAGSLTVALGLLMLVRNPVSPVRRIDKGRGGKKGKDVARGRSRASKDLRGGAAGYESAGE